MAQWHSAPVKNPEAQTSEKSERPAPSARRRIVARLKTFTAAPAVRDSLSIPALKDAAEMWLLDGDARLSPKTMVDRRSLLQKLVWLLETEGHKECGKKEMLLFFAYLRTAHQSPWGR